MAQVDSGFFLDRGQRIEIPAHQKVDIPGISFPDQNTAIVGVRTGQKGGQPYIFVHGFGGNVYNYDSMVKSLVEAQGIDAFAFNWGAHGIVTDQWDLRSGQIKDGSYQVGQHNMDEGISHVVRMIDYVVRTTGKAPIIVSHSMGGIISTLALEGVVTDGSGKTSVNDLLRQWMDAHVLGLNKMASPNKANPEMTPMEKMQSTMALASLIQKNPAGEMPSLPPETVEFLLRMNPMAAYSMAGLVSVYDFYPGEFAHFIARADGHAHEDLKNSVANSNQGGKMTSSDGLVDYESLIFHGKSQVARVIHAAKNDVLAHFNSLKQEALSRHAEFVVSYAGHLGVVAGETLRHITLKAIVAAEKAWSPRSLVLSKSMELRRKNGGISVKQCKAVHLAN